MPLPAALIQNISIYEFFQYLLNIDKTVWMKKSRKKFFHGKTCGLWCTVIRLFENGKDSCSDLQRAAVLV
jgi:hypothetical protein